MPYFSCTEPRAHRWCSHCAGSYPLWVQPSCCSLIWGTAVSMLFWEVPWLLVVSLAALCPLCYYMANSEPLWLHAGKALCCTFGLAVSLSRVSWAWVIPPCRARARLAPCSRLSPALAHSSHLAGCISPGRGSLAAPEALLAASAPLLWSLLFRFPLVLVELVSFSVQLAPGSPYLSSSKAPPGLLQKLQPWGQWFLNCLCCLIKHV